MRNLYLNSFLFDSAVIVFTETWLKPSILNTEVLSTSYSIYRRDRDSKGGGILIAVKSNFFSELILLPYNFDNFNIEFLAIRLKFFSKTFFITCSYIPPHSDESIYFLHTRAITFVSTLLTEDDYLIVCGDFNLANIAWTVDEDDCCLHPSSKTLWICDFFGKLSDCGLNQINFIKNPFNNILDLFFVDSTSFVIKQCSPLSLPEDIFHPTLSLSLNINVTCNISTSTNSKKSLIFNTHS